MVSSIQDLSIRFQKAKESFLVQLDLWLKAEFAQEDVSSFRASFDTSSSEAFVRAVQNNLGEDFCYDGLKFSPLPNRDQAFVDDCQLLNTWLCLLRLEENLLPFEKGVVKITLEAIEKKGKNTVEEMISFTEDTRQLLETYQISLKFLQELFAQWNHNSEVNWKNWGNHSEDCTQQLQNNLNELLQIGKTAYQSHPLARFLKFIPYHTPWHRIWAQTSAALFETTLDKAESCIADFVNAYKNEKERVAIEMEAQIQPGQQRVTNLLADCFSLVEALRLRIEQSENSERKEQERLAYQAFSNQNSALLINKNSQNDSFAGKQSQG